MRKFIGRVTALVLPVKEAKAVPTRSKCVSGCGGDGVWNAGTTMPGVKRPCC